MKENKIIDFLIKKNNIFQKIKFYYNLKKEKVTYDTLCMYIDFLNCLERMFFYDNSKNSPIFSFIDPKTLKTYLILVNEKYQIYITPHKDSKDISIRIYRYLGNNIKSDMTFDYEEINKVTKYDRYLVDTIFHITKNEILKLFKQYVKRV